jgi:predicted esterase
MKFQHRCFITIAVAAAALFSQTASAQQAAQQQPPQAAPGRGRGPGPIRPPDPRVQQRTYHFADADKDMPYALYVSSKVTPAKAAPLIVALHGMGGNQNSLLRGNAIDLAEEGGYILVGPMGYNPQGWFGSPVITPRRGGPGGQQAPIDPPNLRELSEKDVMNVLDIVRKEFNVDPRRTYLMGHSMGGAGTLFLGSKYASNWAAIAAMAPAAFAMLPTATDLLTPIKSTMPVLLLQGDADNVVPPEYARRWAAAMKDLNMNYKYVEMPGEDHGTIIAKSMPEIFRYFDEHSKPATR